MLTPDFTYYRKVFCEYFPRRCFLFYQEAIDYIKNIERSGSDYGLERMRELLALLGNPDDKLKFVHVAGTNGKGSVTAYLTSALKEAGYKVGTYNSPSVFCYNERWLINGNPLCEEDVARYMTVVRECIESEKRLRSAFGLPDFNPTAFEIETAVAMLAFFDKECDICVLEVGLGGRWDATNAISQKELAVITPIGLDHCAILGDTLSEIASEKSAIIKKDCVTVEQCDEVMKEIYHPYVFDENGNKIYVNSNVILCKKHDFMSKIWTVKRLNTTAKLTAFQCSARTNLSMLPLLYVPFKRYATSIGISPTRLSEGGLKRPFGTHALKWSKTQKRGLTYPFRKIKCSFLTVRTIRTVQLRLRTQ